MNLGELMCSLGSQELKAVVAEENLETQTYNLLPQHKRGIVDSINIGLTDLHTKFNLATKELVICSIPYVTEYPLTAEYARSNPAQVPYKFIDDNNADRYMGDLIKIIKVTDQYGMELPINDSSDANTIYTQSFDTLQLTKTNNREKYSVIYQANHRQMVYAEPLDGTQEIILPPSMHEPLRLFVAHKVLSSTNSSEQINKSIQLLNNYNILLDQIRKNGIISANEDQEDTRFANSDFP